jgi:hypothetical protein
LARKYNQDRPVKVVSTGYNSDRILNQWQTNTFAKIFKELDSDQDDIISCYNVNQGSLSKDLKRIIHPIINELKQDNESLNEDEFVKAMCHLYEVHTFIT